MTDRPLVVSVAHRRTVDTVLGDQPAALMYGGYLDNVTRAGASLAILAPGTAVPDAVIEAMDGLLLTGGGDVDPRRFDSALPGRDVDDERDSIELELVRRARERRVPVLGMCRGCQVLNVALGGTLHEVEGHVQAAPLAETVHSVDLSSRSRLGDMLGERRLPVNTYHRWAVETPAPGLAVVGRSEDTTAEAIEWDGDDWFAAGIQWHAELLDAPHVPALFAGLVAAARERRR